MKIVLATYGSRGDVQPMLALSLALKSGGHDVLLAGPPEKADWAWRLNCPFQPIGQDVTSFIDSLKDAHSLSSTFRFVSFLHKSINDLFHELPDVIAHADLVIASSLVFVLATLAESMNVPYRYIAFTPQLLPSGHHPVPIFKHQGYPKDINLSTWSFTRFIDRFNMTRRINRMRKKLGLFPIGDAWPHILGKDVIVATDPIIARVPPDVRQTYVQTGYMHLNQPDYSLPELEEFLKAGPPPVYAGFGSMPRQDQEQNVQIIIEAVRKTGNRVIISKFGEKTSAKTNSTGHRLGADKDSTEKTIPPSNSPVSGYRSSDVSCHGDDVLFIRKYPHLKLFPKMASVIHHGGAGTTASAAAGGIPQIIVPHILDQYYWGNQIHKAGLGPKPIWRKSLTVSNLSQAVQASISDTGMADRAAKTAKWIKRRTPIQMTVNEIIGKNISAGP